MDLFQNTYTNADKLLEAAEQLAQTGECDPEEIYQAAHQLQDRIQDFVRRVEQRKVLLDMSVAFHTHGKEVRLCCGSKASPAQMLYPGLDFEVIRFSLIVLCFRNNFSNPNFCPIFWWKTSFCPETFIDVH